MADQVLKERAAVENRNFDGSNDEYSHEDYDVDGTKVRITSKPGGASTISVYDKTGNITALTIAANSAEVWDYWGWGNG